MWNRCPRTKLQCRSSDENLDSTVDWRGTLPSLLRPLGLQAFSCSLWHYTTERRLPTYSKTWAHFGTLSFWNQWLLSVNNKPCASVSELHQTPLWWHFTTYEKWERSHHVILVKIKFANVGKVFSHLWKKRSVTISCCCCCCCYTNDCEHGQNHKG